jgi:hypothetical protein
LHLAGRQQLAADDLSDGDVTSPSIYRPLILN